MLTQQQKLELANRFFTQSDTVDLFLIEGQLRAEMSNFSKKNKSNVYQYLDMLETFDISLLQRAIKGLYAFCIDEVDGLLKINFPNVQAIYQMDSLPLILSYLPKLTEDLNDTIDNPDSESLYVEQDLRVALNLCFLLIICNIDSPTLSDELVDSPLELFLLELLRSSLDASFIPMKKTVMVFYMYLRSIFSEPIQNKNTYKYLSKELVADMSQEDPRIMIEDPTQVESFYQRLILKGQGGPKPQVIVKSIVMALLANSPQNNKKKVVLDVNREWESPYLLLELLLTSNKHLESYVAKTECYQQYKGGEKNAEAQKEAEAEGNKTVNEGEKHRIFAGNAIVSVFELLLHNFGESNLFQYIFLVQLIADQQGVLVFVKFLTDNFAYLSSKIVPCIYEFRNEEKDYNEVTEDSVYKTIKLTYKVCRGSSEKIESNLIEYNGYFLVKKMPSFFKSSERLVPICNKLLKIQTKLFTKRMRQMASNMKVVAEIYCKETDFKKIEKQKKKMVLMADMASNFKQDDIRKLISEFNQYNYLTPRSKPETLSQRTEPAKCDVGMVFQKMWTEEKLPEGFGDNYEKWLQENVWNQID